MAHAIGLSALGFVCGCAMPTSEPVGSLAGLHSDWYYVPGRYEAIQQNQDGTRTARVSAEANGQWTVTIGEPPTVIVVRRLQDGRPATASIANPARNETAIFDPPLALVPKPGQTAPATEATSVSLYRGLVAADDLENRRPTRTGTAERRFLGLLDQSWSLDGRAYPAQLMRHELVLSLGPAQVMQRYESLAVQGLGIVRETMVERVGVLGVRVSGREETIEVIEFFDRR